jgi:dTDP-glucose 4,6-dehydratase
MSYKRLMVTGGCGFIGSAFCRTSLKNFSNIEILLNLDLLTYAAREDNVAEAEKDPRYLFVKADICDRSLVSSLCREHNIDTIVHFAAESHVDRSIASPRAFYQTNIEGTIALLEAVKEVGCIHLHHVSTDEVYGSLGQLGMFDEKSPYAPNSPYAASKASSDHFVRAYANTYGLSVTLSHCSNNYGPYQHAEKMIPQLIASASEERPFSIYGDGSNIRDWLFVDDHVAALWKILQKGKKGNVYAIGGGCELTNLELVHQLIDAFVEVTGRDPNRLRDLITFVADRPGHDFRYAIDSTKIQNELGWTPQQSFKKGLYQTVRWYLDNPHYLNLEVQRC